MTQEPPFTNLVIEPATRREAEAIVSAHVQREADGKVLVFELALTNAIAEALQIERNRAELAEMERRQAVDDRNALRQSVRELAQRARAAPWVGCSRCGARAPTSATLPHLPGCALSSYPPPRLTLVPPSTDEEPTT
jgi:hypothetical protein